MSDLDTIRTPGVCNAGQLNILRHERERWNASDIPHYQPVRASYKCWRVFIWSVICLSASLTWLEWSEKLLSALLIFVYVCCVHITNNKLPMRHQKRVYSLKRIRDKNSCGGERLSVGSKTIPTILISKYLEVGVWRTYVCLLFRVMWQWWT